MHSAVELRADHDLTDVPAIVRGAVKLGLLESVVVLVISLVSRFLPNGVLQTAVLGVIVVAIGVVLVRRGRANDAALLVLAFAGASVVNALLKLVFHRPRPQLAFVHLDTYSFPSGHAATSSATFTVLAYLLASRHHSAKARIWIGLGAAAAIALVGYSRLYLGAHYLSDVLAGISFGVAWAAASLLAYTLWGERETAALLPRSLRRRLQS